MDVPGREIFWNIPGGQILYVTQTIVVGILLYSIYRSYRRWRLGGPSDRGKELGKRFKLFLGAFFIDGLLHRSFFASAEGAGHGFKSGIKPREFYAGLLHWFIFVGCLVFLAAAFLDFVSHYFLPFMEGNVYLVYSAITDGFGILALVGVGMALVRRYMRKPSRLDNKPDDLVALVLIALVIITGFLVEGFRIAATELKTNPGWAPWSPGGFVFANLVSGWSEPALLTNHQAMWWFHLATQTFGFLYVALYFSRLYHIIWDPVNVFFRKLDAPGALAPIDLEKAESFGVSKIEGFNWKQLLDLDACTRCGRCEDACPAHVSGKVLNPKAVIQDLRTDLYNRHPILLNRKPVQTEKDMITDVVGEESIWDCTTCRACDEVCPVAIEHIDKIVDMRRNLAMERSQFPESVQDALKCLGTRQHPYRGTSATRTDWAEGLNVKMLADDPNVDILYWVGCSAALDERNTRVSKATARVLQAAGIKFGILGAEEACCGDPARRMGDEYLFQTLCQGNIELMKTYKVKKIVTTCPHCFNSLKHEYPQFGGSYEVVPHVDFISGLIKSGKVKLAGIDPRRIAYHDSCYLGRYNDIYQAPRDILNATAGVERVELPRSGPRSFCCGGGGGHMWMEEDPSKRLSTRRIEEVMGAGVDAVATACPYCLAMFEDAIKAKGQEEKLKAIDLSELVVQAMAKKK